MKLRALFLSVLLFLPSLAFAAGLELTYKPIPGLETLAAGSVASGDFVPVYDASATKVKKVDATAFGVSGAYNGTVGATTPAAGTFTTLTASGIAALNGANTSTGSVTFTRTPTADSATTNQTSKVALTAPIDTTGTNTHNAYDVALTVSNATGGTNTVNGYKFDNYTGDAQVNVNAINIGTSDGLGTANAISIGSGWDAGISTDSGVKINSTNGTLVTALRVTSDAVASGQTSKTTALTGVTSSSKCVATVNAVPTNSVFLKSAAPGTDQVVVTASADPGASTLAYTLICVN
jgi:hypothetical protein